MMVIGLPATGTRMKRAMTLAITSWMVRPANMKEKRLSERSDSMRALSRR